MGGGPPGFYRQGSLDGSRPGIFFANTANYKTQPKYEIMRWNYIIYVNNDRVLTLLQFMSS